MTIGFCEGCSSPPPLMSSIWVELGELLIAGVSYSSDPRYIEKILIDDDMEDKTLDDRLRSAIAKCVELVHPSRG